MDFQSSPEVEYLKLFLCRKTHKGVIFDPVPDLSTRKWNDEGKILIQFPPIQGIRPVWTGKGFLIGDKTIPVISYGERPSGWNDRLSLFHEEVSGSDHFIDQASRVYALNQLRRYLDLKSQPVVMDIGCSSGFLIRDLLAGLPGVQLMGADAVSGPLERLARDLPEAPLLHFDLTTCPLPDECLDGVTLLNVIEHIRDDQAALNQVSRILKPGGIALIEVPAGPALFDSYDRNLLHFRRYALHELEQMTRHAGLITLKRSHLGFFLFPGFWLVKKKNRFLDSFQKTSGGDKTCQDEDITRNEIKATRSSFLFHWLMKLELLIGQRYAYPNGIRCLLTVKKWRTASYEKEIHD